MSILSEFYEFEQDWSVGVGATLEADIKLKNIFLVRRIFPGKADSAIFLGFECTINPQNLMKIVGTIFEKMKNLIFFLIWATLNFEGRSKTKNQAGDIFKGILDIECERDCSVSLGATLDDGRKIKNYFSCFRDIPGKANSVIFLGFECTTNPQNLIKIVGAIFEKIKIFNSFSCELPLILGVEGRLKKTARDI